MSRNITELNPRNRYKTWHFTSGLEPTLAIRGDIDWIATRNLDHATNNQQHILLVKACITEKVMSQGRPDCVTFTTWRFSRADAALWVSNARDKIPLTALPFEGYIQSRASLELPRLHQWMPDAIWLNVNGKLNRSLAYQQFSAANDAFEYCHVGSMALSDGGRPRKAISVIAPTHPPPPPPSAGTGSGPVDRAATLSAVRAPLQGSPPRGDSCIRQRMHLSLATRPAAAIA